MEMASLLSTVAKQEQTELAPLPCLLPCRYLLPSSTPPLALFHPRQPASRIPAPFTKQALRPASCPPLPPPGTLSWATSQTPELKQANYSVVSLTKLFDEVTGQKVDRAYQWIGAAAAPGDIAALLELEQGAPVLKVERVTFVSGDIPIESVIAFFHPGRYQHYNELSSKPGEVS